MDWVPWGAHGLSVFYALNANDSRVLCLVLAVVVTTLALDHLVRAVPDRLPALAGIFLGS